MYLAPTYFPKVYFGWMAGTPLVPTAVDYAILQDMIDRYGAAEMTSLTDRTGTGEPNAFAAGTALADATNTIDGYIAGRYRVPLFPVPGNVRQICCAITRFYLWRDNPSEAVTLLYKAAITQLQGIQNGSITLQAAAVDSELTSDSVELVSYSDRTFNRHSLKGF